MKRIDEIKAFARKYKISVAKSTALFAKYARKPKGYRKLVEWGSNAKTNKGEADGYLTGILHLIPSDLSGHGNVCIWANNCKDLCLYKSGMSEAFISINAGRLDKTRVYFEQRADYMASLYWDAFALMRAAAKRNLKPCLRPNGTSDLPKVGMAVAEAFPNLQVYDYTKAPKPWLRQSSNYHLTFSRDNEQQWLSDCVPALEHGINVSVVFDGDELPETYRGYTVINGDVNDLRFRDPKGVVVGLKLKGRENRKAQAACPSEFVVANTTLIQIAA